MKFIENGTFLGVVNLLYFLVYVLTELAIDIIEMLR